MITKPYDKQYSSDRRRRAGIEAEGGTAYYLNRAFANDPDFYLLHDLRLVDRDNHEHNGSPRVAQIDHLVLHRWGAFIVESKSCVGRIEIISDGSGGDQWTRADVDRNSGIRSPIKQAELQGGVMRELLDRRSMELRGRMPIGTRTLGKLLTGSDELGFRNLPIQIIVAYSDNSTFTTGDGWSPPSKPFASYVCKADQVVDKIRREYEEHRNAANIFKPERGKYGLWSMKPEELKNVANSLAEMHEPRPTPATASSQTKSSTTPDSPQRTETAAPPARPATTPRRKPQSSPPSGSPAPGRPACKHCAATRLTASSGKYGYYWKCADCGKNTSMPAVCSICAKVGERGKGVRIRKAGADYFRRCEYCEIEERIWTQPPAARA